MTKVIRVRALDARLLPDVYCTGCLGCKRKPRVDDSCVEMSASGERNDFIFIEDTPEGRAAYAALVLEHGIQP